MPKKIDEDLAIELMLNANLKPLEPYRNMQTPWKCICMNCGKNVSPKLIAIKTNRGGCWECGVKKRKKPRTNIPLTVSHPDIAKEAEGWNASELTAGSNKSMQWKCNLGHVYKMRVQSRLISGKCPVCIGRVLLEGFNDLRTLFPEVAITAHGWDPGKEFSKSTSTKEWTCKEGHIYEARIQERTRKDKSSGCPYCDGKKVLIGFNDLESQFPEVAREADGWDPKSVTSRSNKKMAWKCPKGHKWSAIVGNRTTNHHCPSCAVSGFDINLDGYLYFLENKNWKMFQIGITNYPKQRLGKHGKLGWTPIDIKGPMDGLLTKEWEQDLLNMLRAKGVRLGPKEVAGKFDGYTECWMMESFNVKSLREMMDLARG